MDYEGSRLAESERGVWFWLKRHSICTPHFQRKNERNTFRGRETDFLPPNSGAQEYGYLHWLNPEDPVDPSITHFGGAASQCVYVSRETRTVVVSMGQGTQSNCRGLTDPRNMLPWAVVRDIVSKKTGGNATAV